MSTRVVENAVVEKVSITLDRDVFLTMWLQFKLNGYYQGFGGYVFDSPSKDGGTERVGTAYGAEYIRRVMRLFDVSDMSLIEGQTCRVVRNAGVQKIIGIGHIIEDKWFFPEEDLTDFFGERNE